MRSLSWRAAAARTAQLAVLLALAACASRPDNALAPLGEAALAPGAHRVDMLIATTRQPVETPTYELFGGERSKTLAYAEVAISIPPDAARQIGEVQWPSRSPGDPAREFVALKTDRLEREALRARLRQSAARRGGRVLLFVHGYNNRFDDAVMRFAQIAHDSGAPATPLLFTWPSRGKLLAYAYDRESANYSRDALESVFDMLAAEPAVKEVSVIAHSMGNWVALEALRQSAIRHGRVSPKIQDVMLAAPDVDVDVFGRQIAELGPQRPRLTLFVSRDDQALAFSRRLWGDAPRIGAVNPEAEPYRSQLIAAKIDVYDLTQLRGDGRLNHDKFATSPQIVRLIGGRLAQGQTITDSRVGLGERIHVLTTDTIGAVGGVVAGVVSAPAKALEGKPPIDLQ